jgi:hypothetical protein
MRRAKAADPPSGTQVFDDTADLLRIEVQEPVPSAAVVSKLIDR